MYVNEGNDAETLSIGHYLRVVYVVRYNRIALVAVALLHVLLLIRVLVPFWDVCFKLEIMSQSSF